ncbi:MAG: MauE/DoxX family redox-associated membrane protein [Planctomycetaceae bacterium]
MPEIQLADLCFATRLRRWLALCGLLLVAATWRLWTPQVVFPQIPFLAVLRTVPGWIDWIALTGVVAGLVGLLLTPGERGASALRALSNRAASWFACLFVASLTLLILLDQHRFQPWAYQFAIVAIALAFVPAQRALSLLRLLRLLTIGIYFWSAVSKLDYTFLHGLGPELLRGTLTAFGLEPRWMRSDVATALALAFPLDELAVAALLAFRRTRKYGLILAIAMHVLLLATLGPLGLNHSWGVLLWNVYFIGQDVLLFAPLASGGRQPSESADRSAAAATPVSLSLGRGAGGEGMPCRVICSFGQLINRRG